MCASCRCNALSNTAEEDAPYVSVSVALAAMSANIISQMAPISSRCFRCFTETEGWLRSVLTAAETLASEWVLSAVFRAAKVLGRGETRRKKRFSHPCSYFPPRRALSTEQVSLPAFSFESDPALKVSCGP